MRTLYLNAVEDPNHGGVGLIVEGTPFGEDFTPNVAMTGELIAHDILEHQNGLGAIGSLDDELEAFGGLWYNRGCTGQFRDGPMWVSCDDSLASEVAEMGLKYLYRGFETPVPKTLSYTEHECTLEWIANEGFKKAVERMNDENEYNSRNDKAYDIRKLREYRKASLLYMCRGAYKANKRFETHNHCHSTFWDMARMIDPYAENCEEGQRFKLQYNFQGVLRFNEVELQYE